MTTIQKINPINKEEERQKFFFDPLYNPQFEYEEEVSEREFTKYGAISDRYLPEAKAILEHVVKKYGGEEGYIEAIEGENLNREETEQYIQNYLEESGVAQQLTVRYSSEFVARTSVNQDEMRVRLPVEYGEKAIESVMHHEVGTHYFRTLNERQRPWYKNRSAFDLHSYAETEEGLAIIHQFMILEEPYLWRSALYYYGCWYGNQKSFAQLNKELSKYIQTPDRRWKSCLRIKRGFKDTSEPGAFSRDQIYLSGVIKVLEWLRTHDYDPHPLFLGKIAVEDVDRLMDILKISSGDILLPSYLQNYDRKTYTHQINRLISTNFPTLFHRIGHAV